MHNMRRLQPDAVLRNRYRILDELGAGGGGVVYKARDMQQDDRDVAIKEIQPHGLSPEKQREAQQAFEREVALLQRITPHAHLPEFYEAFSGGNRSYIVMQYIPGTNLDKTINGFPNHQLSEQQAMDYAKQLCDALSYLHAQKPDPIIFRDLKPSNIMVTPTDQIVLIDFGISRFFTPNKPQDTFYGASKGYAPPEQFLLQRTEPVSDIFSFGATLHHCLTGHSPLDNEPLFNFLPVLDYNSQVSAGFDRLIMHMLATDMAKRPQTILEVASELSTIEQSQQVTAGDNIYYDPTVDQVFFLWQSTLSLLGRLPSFLALNLVLPLLWLCAKLGQSIINGIQALTVSFYQGIREVVTAYQKRRQQARDKRSRPQPVQPPQSPDPPQSPAPGLNVLRQVAEVPIRIGRVIIPAVQVSIWPPLIGMLLITVVGGICLEVFLHGTLHLLSFALVLLLLVPISGTYVSSHATDETRQLLGPMLLGIALAGFVLFSQPDVRLAVENFTMGQSLSLFIVLLAGVSLFRPADRWRWLDHVALMALQLIAIELFLFLAPPIMQSLELPSNAIQAIASAGVLVLVGSFIFSLVRIKSPFSSWDAFPIAGCAMIILLLQGFDSPFALSVNAIVIVVTMCFIVCSWDWLRNQPGVLQALALWLHRISLPRLGHLPLVLLALIALLLQSAITGYAQNASSDPTSSLTNFLMMQPLAPSFARLFVSILLVIAIGLFLYWWFKKTLTPLAYHLLLVGLGLLNLLLLISHWTDGSQIVGQEIEQRFAAPLAWVVGILLLLAALSAILSLTQRSILNRPFFAVSDLLLGLGTRVLLVVYAALAAFMALAYGNGDTALRTPQVIAQGIEVTYAQALLAGIGVVIVLALSRLIYVYVNRSAAVPTSRKAGSSQHNALEQFSGWDYIPAFVLMLCLLVLWNIPERQGVLATRPTIWPIFVAGTLPLWQGIAGLLAVAFVSLLWLSKQFKPATLTALRLLLPCAFVFLALALAGQLISRFLPLSSALLIVGLFLLIEGSALAVQANTERNPRHV
jgi:serine/threonine protein kinase